MVCQGEIEEPPGIELVFISSKIEVLTHSRAFPSEVILNIYNTMSNVGALSAGCFTTVFSGSTLVLVVGFETAETADAVNLEILLNFFKVLGCLYPDSRLFYVNTISKFITIARLTGIADGFVGSYPHRFLLTQEAKEDRVYVWIITIDVIGL